MGQQPAFRIDGIYIVRRGLKINSDAITMCKQIVPGGTTRRPGKDVDCPPVLAAVTAFATPAQQATVQAEPATVGGGGPVYLSLSFPTNLAINLSSSAGILSGGSTKSTQPVACALRGMPLTAAELS